MKAIGGYFELADYEEGCVFPHQDGILLNTGRNALEYILRSIGEVKHICYDCVDKLFHKTLSAEIVFQSKTKSKEDMARITRNKMLKEQKQ